MLYHVDQHTDGTGDMLIQMEEVGILADEAELWLHLLLIPVSYTHLDVYKRQSKCFGLTLLQ